MELGPNLQAYIAAKSAIKQRWPFKHPNRPKVGRSMKIKRQPKQ